MKGLIVDTMPDDRRVYIYEKNQIHESPEALARYLQVDISDVMHALNHPKNAGVCNGFHICWEARRRPGLYHPVRIIEKDMIFPSIRHMAYFYNCNPDAIRDALYRHDGFWYGWHLEFVDKVPEPTVYPYGRFA